MDRSIKSERGIAAAMIALGACARVIPHPWNFTPMLAIGLFAGVKADRLRAGVTITLAALLLSDALIGFYKGMWYVYAAALIPVIAGRCIRPRAGSGAIAIAALGAGLAFFLFTNAMVWALGHLYPHTPRDWCSATSRLSRSTGTRCSAMPSTPSPCLAGTR